ncbi:hypothetical protein ACIOTI_31685 [Streptomyces sp. NPDC087843]|uniref:hypothetical protein n=1 Tax=Streptomyces sp. NPDC087843 TaxID=3365804 RepID=UPI00380B9150
MSLSELRSRAPAGSLTVPQRPDFHHLLTLTHGSLRNAVDFTGYALKPGSWLWVRPGQVHQWGDLRQAEGILILFEHGFLDPATVAAARLDDLNASPVQLPVGDDRDALKLAAEHLDRESQALRQLPLEVHISVLRHLLAVLVLAVGCKERDHLVPTSVSHHPETTSSPSLAGSNY